MNTASSVKTAPRDTLDPEQDVKLNRRNLYARDTNRCQYCGKHFPTRELTLDHVVPRVLGGEQRDWSGDLRPIYASVADQVAAVRANRIARLDPGTPPPVPLEQFVGVYRHDLFGDVEVSLEEDVLLARLRPLLTLELRPAGGYHFLAYGIRRGFEDASDEHKYVEPMFGQFEIDADNTPVRFQFLDESFERVRDEDD